jgi:hypothetical protein
MVPVWIKRIEDKRLRRLEAQWGFRLFEVRGWRFEANAVGGWRTKA